MICQLLTIASDRWIKYIQIRLCIVKSQHESKSFGNF